MSWTAPKNMGPPITGYTVQYRKGSDPFSADNCQDATAIDNCQNITGTSTTITELVEDTTYEVRVQATNAERASEWSATGTGRTNRANHQPIFDDRPHIGDESVARSPFTVSRRVDENTGPGRDVGRVFADDTDNDKLTYKLSGTDAGMFDINETTGQIRTKAGVTYNYEDIADTGTCDPLTDTNKIGSDRCYTVMVEVRDGLDDDRVEMEEATPDDSITVKIGVRDRDEPPAVPTVTVTSPIGNTTLEVFWDSKNTGPVITSYDLQYRKGGGTFLDDNCQGATENDNCTDLDNDNVEGNATTITSTTITGLEEDTSYSVQMRATNDEGTSAWSRVVTVKTNKEGNTPPTFVPGSPNTLSVPENTRAGQDIGTPVNASDEVQTSLTYRLEGRDAALFTINSTTGQIRTRSALNTEAICDPTDADSAGWAPGELHLQGEGQGRR